MKRKVLSIMVAVFVLLFSTNALAATAWFQDDESNTSGMVETEVVATATNGTAELITGKATTDLDPLNYDFVEFKFTADSGYELGGQDDNIFGANDPLVEGYYFSAEMRALWQWSEIDEDVLPNLDDYYDLNTSVVDTDGQYYVTIRVSVDRNDVPFPEGEVLAHLEPELSASVSVTFVPEEVEPEYYAVTAESIPSAVATFTGTGTEFMTGNDYSVGYTIVDSDYEFVEWVTPNSGTIEESDVHVQARFRKKSTPPVFYYTVTAVSAPAGVATFTGTGTDFVFGSDYDVQYTQVVDGYVFTGWSAANSGTITGHVDLIANFEPIEVPDYNVTAVSQPAGVATFDGTLTDVLDGTDYSVSIASVEDGYEFVEWIVAPTGTIDGADVEVIAVFDEVEEFLDEEVAEEIPDEELPEAGGIPTVAFSGIGLAIAAIGKKIRK